MKCPICKSGEIKDPLLWGKKTPDNRVMAKLLSKEGYSIREIMRFLNYKSPNTVAKLLNKSYTK